MLRASLACPKGVAPPPDDLKVGYTFIDYDKAARFTWRFLRDATAEQVRSVVTRIFAGDNQLVNGLVLRRLVRPGRRRQRFRHRVFGLWNGRDGIAPPAYMGVTFPATRRITSLPARQLLIQADIEDCMRAYHRQRLRGQPGSQLIILANPAEGELIQGWRAGVESRDRRAESEVRLHPELKCAAVPTSENVVGAIPPPDYHGLKVRAHTARHGYRKQLRACRLRRCCRVGRSWLAQTTRSRFGSTQNPRTRACGLSPATGRVTR